MDLTRRSPTRPAARRRPGGPCCYRDHPLASFSGQPDPSARVGRWSSHCNRGTTNRSAPEPIQPFPKPAGSMTSHELPSFCPQISAIARCRRAASCLEKIAGYVDLGTGKSSEAIAMTSAGVPGLAAPASNPMRSNWVSMVSPCALRVRCMRPRTDCELLFRGRRLSLGRCEHSD